jgi:VWFA-related protein
LHGRGAEEVVKAVAVGVGSALLLVIVSAVGAQPPAADRASQRLFRSGTQLVSLSVTATDPNRQPVQGLRAEDFVVLEDGVEQPLEFFESAEIPLDLILLVDASSSMTDKMDVVHEAAIGFVKTLRPGDRGALVAFADGVHVIQPLTSDGAALEQAIRRTTARGATALHNALYISLKQFGRGARQRGDLRRQAIAVLSDGEDTSSLVSFDDVLALARKSGVSIYPIALQAKGAAARLAASGQRRYFSEAEYSMRTLAQETGAQAFFPLQIFELKSIYATIAQELSSQYSLAYAPIDGRFDGRFRKITVRVPSRPEIRLRTRTGYTAEMDRAAAASFVPQQR